MIVHPRPTTPRLRAQRGEGPRRGAGHRRGRPDVIAFAAGLREKGRRFGAPPGAVAGKRPAGRATAPGRARSRATAHPFIPSLPPSPPTIITTAQTPGESGSPSSRCCCGCCVSSSCSCAHGRYYYYYYYYYYYDSPKAFTAGLRQGKGRQTAGGTHQGAGQKPSPAHNKPLLSS